MNQQVTRLVQQLQRLADTVGLPITQLMLGDPNGPKVQLPPTDDERPRGVGWQLGAAVYIMFRGVGQHLEQTVLTSVNSLLAATTDWRTGGSAKLNELVAQYNQLRTDIITAAIPTTAAEVVHYPHVTGISLTSSSSTVAVGETLQFSASISGDDGPLIWSVSDATVATVNQVGLVTGVATGTTAVYATYGGVTGLAGLTVT